MIPVYIIVNGRLVDILPIDTWDSLSYYDVIVPYGSLDDPDFHFDWVVIHNNSSKRLLKEKIALVP